MKHQLFRRRRAQFAGHCSRSKCGETVGDLATMDKTRRKLCRPKLSYLELVASEFGMTATELENVMQDRRQRRSIVNNICGFDPFSGRLG